MRSIAYIWDDFVERHPKLVKWIREGGLFVLVSNLITVLKATPLRWGQRASADLLPQSCSMKNGKYIQYSRIFHTFACAKTLAESPCPIMRCCLKYFLLTFLSAAFAFLGSRDFGFPGIDLTLSGIRFKWYIIGYGADQGGIAYFTAYMIAMVIGEFIYFFIQRGWVFRSKGNIAWQGM